MFLLKKVIQVGLPLQDLFNNLDLPIQLAVRQIGRFQQLIRRL